ncbi:MAG: sugar phosphate isomerase/epimerase family protein [candidate division NC10 bacterium]
MNVWLDDYCLYQAGVKPEAFVFLERARELGVGGIHFSVIDSFASTSQEYLSRLKATADAYGLGIEVGMGSCCPFSDTRAARDAGRDPRESLRELLPIAQALGSPIVRTFFGGEKDRFIHDPPLAQRMEETVRVLRDMKRLAEDVQVTIAMENHLAETSSELREMLEKVDSPYVGVCFDTANSLLLLEDPLDACRNLLPFIRSTHLKDGVLVLDDRAGALYIGTLPGEGSCHIREIVAMIYAAHPEVNLNIEDLWNTFRVPVTDADFVAGLGPMPATRIAAAFDWVLHGERMLRERRIPTPAELAGDGRWGIVRDRYPRCVEKARAILAEIRKGV